MLKKLKLVEFEIHSYCNRKCEWCPNRDIDRTFFEKINKESFIKLIDDLKRNNFDGILSFSRFSEHFYKPNLLIEYMKLIRNKLPDVEIKIHSNGDFVKKEVLDKIKIDRLLVTDYDNKSFDEIDLILNDWGVRHYDIKKTHTGIIFTGYSNGIEVRYRTRWTNCEVLEDRGNYFTNDEVITLSGTVIKWKNQRKRRKNIPCVEPFTSCAIDYNGNVMPCCHLRSDYNPHKKYIMGNINDNNLSTIFNSNKYNTMIDMVVNQYLNPQTCVNECITCNKYKNKKIIEDVLNNIDSYKLGGKYVKEFEIDRNGNSQLL